MPKADLTVCAALANRRKADMLFCTAYVGV
jgi:hypothetical protein